MGHFDFFPNFQNAKLSIEKVFEAIMEEMLVKYNRLNESTQTSLPFFRSTIIKQKQVVEKENEEDTQNSNQMQELNDSNESERAFHEMCGTSLTFEDTNFIHSSIKSPNVKPNTSKHSNHQTNQQQQQQEPNQTNEKKLHQLDQCKNKFTTLSHTTKVSLTSN